MAETSRAASVEASLAAGSLITGWLREHGEAPHKFRPMAERSYFLRLDTAEGPRVIWSPGLERAFAQAHSKPQVGDKIGVRQIEIRPRASGDRVPPSRSYWIVERSDFFSERAAAARALRDPRISARDAISVHPDLRGSYTALYRARLVAESRIAVPENRERFLSLVREALASAAELGEPLPRASLPERGSARSPRSPEDERSR